jgi:Spy/CpxP family protein refolding chaperone
LVKATWEWKKMNKGCISIMAALLLCGAAATAFAAEVAAAKDGAPAQTWTKVDYVWKL